MSKVNKTELVALLVDLGFPNAADWDDSKLKARAVQIPAKVKEADVDKKNVEIFKRLCAANGEVDLGVSAKGEKKGGKPAKPEASPAKAGEKKPVTKEKKAPKETIKVERDAFNCRKGTLAAQVNGVMTDEWQTDEEISKASKVPMVQTRDRLYFAASKGQFDYRKLIQYRIKPSKK